MLCDVNSTYSTYTIFFNYSSSAINKIINAYYRRTRPTDQQIHTSVQLIFELVMVRDGAWSLSDNNFTNDYISAVIGHLCTAGCSDLLSVFDV